MPRTVVLVPTYDHVETLRPAVNSAVNQTDRDLEVHIIGDGAPPATQQVADELCSRHRQVHFHAHPKSPRTGEPYRDALLRRVDAQFALYLSDDDVWAPDHCSVLTSALKDHDLASTLSTYVRPGETSIHLSRLQFADPADCDLELHHQSRVSLTETGHRVDSYLQLPYGWRTTPTGEHTDHWMWKQWLAQDWVRATTVEQITQIHFADFMRKEMPVGERGVRTGGLVGADVVTDLEHRTH